ncbi:MAG: hypothetical protein LKI39_13295 [Bacteroides sp.]|jgi:hypothetical protein|nr:hypothetical protein [Bacteroides sp.]MCI1683512.1 hypothetical protein [Bacteroides sp.]
MKTKWIISLSILLAITIPIKGQKLPTQNSFTICGGLLFSLSEGKGNYMDITNKPLSYFIESSYRHYLSPAIAFGATYEYISSSRNGNEMKNHFIAPTFTFRYLMDENTNAVWSSIGAGCLFYSDKLRNTNFYSSGSTFSKGYFCISWAFGYDFAITKMIGMQLKAEFLFADWHFNSNYTPKFARDNPDEYQTIFDNNLTYVSLGIALQFGK